ncbi:MAG: glutamate-5-semialdehyde dehydrogenase [Clostridia bacterium]
MVEISKICKISREASLKLASYTTSNKNLILDAIANALESNTERILAQNALDIKNLDVKDAVFVDRLTLTAEKIKAMSNGVRSIVLLADPVGKVTSKWTRPNGLEIKKVRAPLGVVAIIYEARPNVTVDAAALCIKSGNAVILRGSKGAINSNRILFEIMQTSICRLGFDPNIVQFIDDINRNSVDELLLQDKYIDVIIPRGGEALKHHIIENSKIPVIASAGGNCHIFVENSANFDMAVNIIINAKVSRPSVCNATEHILVDENIASAFIPICVNALAKNNVQVRGDSYTKELCNGVELMEESDFCTEYLSLTASVSVVKNVDEAICHINAFGTKHSEAIISKNEMAIKRFQKEVDAAVIYVNASTRFTDGYEFGFGAEMAISTNKLHARGPLGLEQLTSEKYLVEGEGQIRR